MSIIQSCGFLVFRQEPQLSFLLMQHLTRWDLPKGHVDKGETELQCALRELQEETGIDHSMVDIDQQFRFDLFYTVTLSKFKYQARQKKLTIFLAKLLQPEFGVSVSEHHSYCWFDWEPPHDIQPKTINPVLQAVQRYWSGNSIDTTWTTIPDQQRIPGISGTGQPSGPSSARM